MSGKSILAVTAKRPTKTAKPMANEAIKAPRGDANMTFHRNETAVMIAVPMAQRGVIIRSLTEAGRLRTACLNF